MPSTEIVPRSGVRKPSTHSIVVVLPAPFGPLARGDRDLPPRGPPPNGGEGLGVRAGMNSRLDHVEAAVCERPRERLLELPFLSPPHPRPADARRQRAPVDRAEYHAGG